MAYSSHAGHSALSYNLSLVSHPLYTSFTGILLASLSKPLEVIFGGWVGLVWF